MRILFFGDVVGKIGRKALANVVPEARKELNPDVVIVNGENMAHGLGITRSTLEEVLACGVDAVTTGNHIGAKEEFSAILAAHGSRVLRPANYPPSVPGRGVHLLDVGSRKVAVINLMGRVFMHEILDCPFRTFDALMHAPEVAGADVIIVDFHAEATSEKNALGWHINGRAHAMVGSHTHVPSADAKILPGGTAYVTDMGMVGGRDGVIGVQKEGPLQGFLTQLSTRFEVIESGIAQVNAVVIDIDLSSRRATSIQRFDKEVSIV